MNQDSATYFQRVIMNGIQDMIFVVEARSGPSFYYTSLNIAAMKGTGLSQDVVGKSLCEVNPTSKAKLLVNKYGIAYEQKEITTYEDLFLSAENQLLYSKTTLTPLLNDANECTHIVAVVKDITKEKKAEQEAMESRKKLLESNQRYHSLYAYNLDAIISIDLQGRIVDGNAAAKTITGYSIDEIQEKSYYEFVHTEDVPNLQKQFKEVINGQFQELQISIKNKYGIELKLMVKLSPIIINEEVTGVYSIFKDITEQEETLSKLKQSDERFRIISKHGHILITLLDENGAIIYASPSSMDILGYHPNEYKGKLFLHNTHPDDRTKLNEHILHSIKYGKPCTLKFRQQHHSKGWIWTELSANPIFNEQGYFVQMVVLTRDITLQREYEEQLERLAMYDPLTDLPNRRYFNESLAEAVNAFNHGSSNQMISLFVLDIDQFKSINDNLGHDLGDAVIKMFAERVRACLGPNQLIYRMGGDEFAILITDGSTKNDIVMLANRIVEVSQEPMEVLDVSIHVTSSIGIAIAETPSVTEYCIYKQADLALYEAKRAGKNTFMINQLNKIYEG